jgi:hypothetical protein
MTPTDLPLLSTADWLLVVGGILAAVTMLALVIRGYRRWRAARLDLAEPPPLLIPVERRGSGPSPLAGMRFSQNGTLGQAQPMPGGGLLHPTAQNGSNGVPVGVPASMPAAMESHVSAMPGGPTPTFTNDSSQKVVHTMPPMDGTLQFLPGRLEVIDGEAPGRDIRFVRTWGEVPEITFGRVTGPPYRHIQLKSQTVSRQHARMQYTDGRWKLTNLSQTNPVVVNGQALETAHGSRVLRDGDQIEMGEVVFRFRER